MAFLASSAASRRFFYPLWDIYDRSVKLKEMDRLTAAQWRPYDEMRGELWPKLEKAVAYAYEKCPYYRSRGTPAPRSWEDFCRVPILGKAEIRRHQDGLLSKEFRKSDLIGSKTGGSTGVSLELYFDKRCQEKRNAAALWSDQWSGWRLGEPVGALWGNPALPRTWKEKIRNALLDRIIYLDTVSLSDRSMGEFAKRLASDKVRFLFGHSHSLYIFAKYAAAHPVPRLKVEGIISTSMMLLPGERSAIEKAFGCRVTDRYGCEEVGLIGCECEKGNGMHLNTEHLHVEFLRADGSPAPPGEEGRIIVTDLINRGMPLIRYEVGDIGVPSSRTCPCGRGLPLMEKVIGRTADCLVAKDGRLVAGVSLVERTLTAIAGLEQLQIIQEGPEEIRLNVVPDSKWSPRSERQLKEEMESALGPGIAFTISMVTKMEQEKNGKYRFSICRIGHAYQADSSKIR